MPVLFALFFVFGSTIELRGQAFLWLPDLARPDPIYVIPILMGASMFVLSKVGQMGMPPNPQTKMMLYFMPVLMTVLFMPLASGLNLYYSISNLASIPQQWLLAQERLRRNPPVPVPPPAPAKKARRPAGRRPEGHDAQVTLRLVSRSRRTPYLFPHAHRLHCRARDPARPVRAGAGPVERS